MIEVKDPCKAAGVILKNGGKVDYDPNLGIGHEIPFLIVTLPGEKVVDERFLKSLELKSDVRMFQASASGSDNCGCNDQPANNTKDGLSFDTLFVPVEDIKLPELKSGQWQSNRQGREGRRDRLGGRRSPPFSEPMIFWDDSTQEGRIELKKVSD